MSASDSDHAARQAREVVLVCPVCDERYFGWHDCKGHQPEDLRDFLTRAVPAATEGRHDAQPPTDEETDRG